MQITSTRTVARCAALTAAVLLLPHVAAAQIGINNSAGQQLLQPNSTPTPRVVPPPALPGATARPGSVAPPAGVALDMSPNDALFDAINRGDVAAARDALSRGAQLSAQNILGLTPIELAVDLGRNDIAFLLLSMRDSSGSGSARPAPSGVEKVTAKPALPAKPTRPAKVTARKAAPVTPPAPPQQPKLFANDGGAPIPGIGFLGFGQRGTP